MHHVTTSTSLNIEWTNHTVWDDKTKESYEGEPELNKKRKKTLEPASPPAAHEAKEINTVSFEAEKKQA